MHTKTNQMIEDYYDFIISGVLMGGSMWSIMRIKSLIKTLD